MHVRDLEMRVCGGSEALLAMIETSDIKSVFYLLCFIFYQMQDPEVNDKV